MLFLIVIGCTVMSTLQMPLVYFCQNDSKWKIFKAVENMSKIVFPNSQEEGEKPTPRLAKETYTNYVGGSHIYSIAWFTEMCSLHWHMTH